MTNERTKNEKHTEYKDELLSAERLYETTPYRWLWEEHNDRYHFVISGKGLNTFKKKILDCACGAGYGSFILSLQNEVTGIDLSEEAINYAKKRYVNNGLGFVLGTAEKLPFKNKSFDVIVSFETIEHLKNPGKFILEVKRVLKDNGTLIVSTPNKSVFSPHLQKPLINDHIQEFHLQELLNLLSGFDIKIYGQHLVDKSILDKNSKITSRKWIPRRIRGVLITLSNRKYYKTELKEISQDFQSRVPTVYIIVAKKFTHPRKLKEKM